jgi:hypothetical protein
MVWRFGEINIDRSRLRVGREFIGEPISLTGGAKKFSTITQ